jgi:HK97 family phage prohead protease
VSDDLELVLTCVPFGPEARVPDEADGRPVYERFQRGAFRAAHPDRVQLRYSHYRGRIGHVLTLGEAEHGLTATVRLDPGPLADRLVRSSEDGTLGVSVGFAPLLHHYERGEAGAVLVRELVRLHELSLTYNPAYTGTRVRTRDQVEAARMRAWLDLLPAYRVVGRTPPPPPVRRRATAQPAGVAGGARHGGLRYHTAGRVLSVR